MNTQLLNKETKKGRCIHEKRQKLMCFCRIIDNKILTHLLIPEN